MYSLEFLYSGWALEYIALLSIALRLASGVRWYMTVVSLTLKRMPILLYESPVLSRRVLISLIVSGVTLDMLLFVLIAGGRN